MLEDATGKDRSYLLAHEEELLPIEIAKKLQKQIERRANHEPLAYVRGKSEFYGREFMVNKHTLEPRPETETMVELLKQLADGRQPTADSLVVDVGTGSGCIGITVKLELPGMEVVCVDISQECLIVAKQNAEKLGANVKYYQGNLLAPVKDLEPDVLVCNLPYVPDSHTINQAAMQEPKLAIFGGHDGLDLYRKMFAQICESANKPRFIFTESLPFQHKKLAKIASKAGYELNGSEDFIQVFSLLEQLPV